MPRWTFKNGACVKFTYGGCEGSNNRFISLEECKRVCKVNDGAMMPCLDKPGVVGPCAAKIPKFTFKNGSCKMFYYGGCQGSTNRFDSWQECNRACRKFG